MQAKNFPRINGISELLLNKHFRSEKLRFLIREIRSFSKGENALFYNVVINNNKRLLHSAIDAAEITVNYGFPPPPPYVFAVFRSALSWAERRL